MIRLRKLLAELIFELIEPFKSEFLAETDDRGTRGVELTAHLLKIHVETLWEMMFKPVENFCLGRCQKKCVGMFKGWKHESLLSACSQGNS